MTTSSTANRRIELSQKAIARRFKEGRGSGSGRDYQPFLTVRDVPSSGRVHRLPSSTVGRVHHLLSDLEHQIFCQLDWYSVVTDIREQFPIPLEDSKALADRLGIAHPSIQGVDQVVTTDFIVDLTRNGKIIKGAISAKYADELDDPRTLEKIELERRYWLEKDMQFCIATDREIPRILVQNIKWIRPFLTSYEFKHAELMEYFATFNDVKKHYPSHKISVITNKLDEDFNLDIGTHLSIFRHLLAQRAFIFDMVNISVKNLVWGDMVPSEYWIVERYEYVVGE